MFSNRYSKISEGSDDWKKIKTIERLILATKPSYTKPIDILEKIIKDADLDNL
jgi:predicted RNA binding protein YcfA (HicA-like mRNA interferase family)